MFESGVLLLVIFGAPFLVPGLSCNGILQLVRLDGRLRRDTPQLRSKVPVRAPSLPGLAEDAGAASEEVCLSFVKRWYGVFGALGFGVALRKDVFAPLKSLNVIFEAFFRWRTVLQVVEYFFGCPFSVTTLRNDVRLGRRSRSSEEVTSPRGAKIGVIGRSFRAEAQYRY